MDLTTVLQSKQVKSGWRHLIRANPLAPRVELSEHLYAKSQSYPPELGQTTRSLISHIRFIRKELYQNQQNLLADLGQTQLWPNIC